MPASVDPDWLERDAFKKPFDNWIKRVRSYKDVFLGYSSEAAAVGELIKRLLENKLGLTVYDWRDFSAGETIWDSIEKAEQLTACGMFLFMADDRLQAGRKRMAAPRDNVVYEAGYYAGAKGRRYAAIIRERGAKVPTDLGGVKYLELEDRGDISPLESGLRSYLKSVLGFETQG
jgi:predicted nucleotide-binding protein